MLSICIRAPSSPRGLPLSELEQETSQEVGHSWVPILSEPLWPHQGF